jgi:hypothetical protein
VVTTAGPSSQRLVLLGQGEELVQLGPGQLCLVNQGQAAFCRVVYDWELLQQIGKNLASFGTLSFFFVQETGTQL